MYGPVFSAFVAPTFHISDRERAGLSLNSVRQSQEVSDFQVVKKKTSWRDLWQVKRPRRRNGKKSTCIYITKLRLAFSAKSTNLHAETPESLTNPITILNFVSAL